MLIMLHLQMQQFLLKQHLLYNANNANSAIAILDFGGVKTSTNGTFELQFPTANASAGLIRIA